jgi:hypothetical protein
MQQYDTSNGNHYTRNRLGLHPSGVIQPNGVDFSWDEQGIGNCWDNNVSSTGAVTDDTEVIALPDCSGSGSLSPVGNVTKTARNAPCSTYDREEQRNPVGCTWFTSPVMPAARQNAPRELTPVPAGYQPPAAPGKTAIPPKPAGNGLAATGASLVPAAAGLAVAALLLAAHRRRRSA